MASKDGIAVSNKAKDRLKDPDEVDDGIE